MQTEATSVIKVLILVFMWNFFIECEKNLAQWSKDWPSTAFADTLKQVSNSLNFYWPATLQRLVMLPVKM
jgi:hypothetical protein